MEVLSEVLMLFQLGFPRASRGSTDTVLTLALIVVRVFACCVSKFCINKMLPCYAGAGLRMRASVMHCLMSRVSTSRRSAPVAGVLQVRPILARKRCAGNGQGGKRQVLFHAAQS